jgi:hypothetical protein
MARHNKLTGEPKPYKARVKLERTCVVCEESFHPTRADALYCSAKCRQIACRAVRSAFPSGLETRIRARLRAMRKFV